MWAYKYDSRAYKDDNGLTGIKAHADQAAINVNFWITPESGNLDKNSGGLKIWNKLPPSNWDFSAYNSLDRSPKIKEMLDSEGIPQKTIPYRENRAVIFDGRTLHCGVDCTDSQRRVCLLYTSPSPRD